MVLLNQCIRKKLVRTVAGQQAKTIDELLLRRDLQLAYGVRNQMPIMLYDEAVEIQYIADRQWMTELRKISDLTKP